MIFSEICDYGGNSCSNSLELFELQIDFEFERRSTKIMTRCQVENLGKIINCSSSPGFFPENFSLWGFFKTTSGDLVALLQQTPEEKLFRTRHTIKRQFSIPLISIKNDCWGSSEELTKQYFIVNTSGFIGLNSF